MNHVVDVAVLFEHGIESSLVGDIEVHKLRPLTADELDAVEDFGGGVVQIVRNHCFVACFEEREDREGADVACPSVEKLALDFPTWNAGVYPTTSTAGGAIIRLANLLSAGQL